MQKEFKKLSIIVSVLFLLFLLMNCDPFDNEAVTDQITGTRAAYPNLRPVSFAAPSSALPGGIVGSGMSLDVNNNGSVAADNSLGYIFVGFYLSTNSTFGSGDVLLTGGRESVTLPIAAGATVPVGIYSGMKIPAGTTPGKYYLLAVVDETKTVTESNEDDNVAARPITILSPIPNLRPRNFVAPSSSVPGGTVGSGMSLNVNNNGPVAADNSLGYIFVGFYLSTNNTFGSGDVLLTGGRESVTLPIAAGATVPVSIYSGMKIPAGTVPGSYYLLAVVDETKTVAESNENDNVSARPITIN